jgi:hypothetical protein
MGKGIKKTCKDGQNNYKNSGRAQGEDLTHDTKEEEEN